MKKKQQTAVLEPPRMTQDGDETRVKFSVMLPRSLKRQIDIQAALGGEKKQELVERILRAYFEAEAD